MESDDDDYGNVDEIYWDDDDSGYEEVRVATYSKS